MAHMTTDRENAFVIQVIPVNQLAVGMTVIEVPDGAAKRSAIAIPLEVTNQEIVAKIRAAEADYVVVAIDRSNLDFKPHEQTNVAVESNLSPHLHLNEPLVPLIEVRREIQTFRHEVVELIRRISIQAHTGKALDVSDADSAVSRIVRTTFRNKGALMPMLCLRDYDRYSFRHSVNVASLATLMGISLGYDESRLHQLFIGAALHDIGKTCIQDEILNKPASLTQDEHLVMRGHVLAGLRILERTAGISDVALETVTYHHEKLDGSGYPFELEGDQIPEHAQIVAIADAYDAMTSGRKYMPRYDPATAIGRMESNAGNVFSKRLLTEFIRIVGAYPVGTLVRLNSGLLAIVTATHQDVPRRPTVLAIFDTVRSRSITPLMIELHRHDENQSIESCERFEDWRIDPACWTKVIRA